MNIALDRLQYLSQAAPLEKQLTFHELQNRPLGFQTAIPRDPIGEAMNGLLFKSMEGAMYENAAYAGQMMRSEQMKDVLVGGHFPPRTFVWAWGLRFTRWMNIECIHLSSAYPICRLISACLDPSKLDS